MRIYYLIAELIFKHRSRIKYLSFQYSVAYCSHLAGSDVVLRMRTRSAFSRSVVSVVVSSLGRTDLFFIDQGTKVNGQYYRDVLLHQQLLPAIRHLSGDFFTFQQDNASVHTARETACSCSLNLWNIRLLRSSSVASQQSWPEPGRLPDLGKHHTTLTSWSHASIEEWEHFRQVFIDEATWQWHPRV